MINGLRVRVHNSPGFSRQRNTGLRFLVLRNNQLKVFGINYDKVQKYFSIFPDEKEQKYIEQLLFLTDHLIAANQRKLEKLKELKKGYLQKMFC
ncbi:restriction endonuclease subunit S [Lacticaseibacillus paracasei]|uniref:restriction endonuclease subunit S n=2 Tax=Lacticaseibacillus paracasei TaxID=1597 RepID=UPI0031FCA6FD